MAMSFQFGVQGRRLRATDATSPCLFTDSQSQLASKSCGRSMCQMKNGGSGERRGVQRMNSVRGGGVTVAGKNRTLPQGGGEVVTQLSIVMKFGGSSVASAERMREVADLIQSCSEERPVVVLSAMGNTTNKLLMAGQKAAAHGVDQVSKIEELVFIRELHLKTVDDLGVGRSTITGEYPVFDGGKPNAVVLGSRNRGRFMFPKKCFEKKQIFWKN